MGEAFADRVESVFELHAGAAGRYTGRMQVDGRERTNVTRLATIFLIGLITLCPFVCGAEVVDSGAHRHAATGHDSVPAHCPDDSDNCICQGAVQADPIRLANPDLFVQPILIADAIATTAPLLAHLTCDGSPAGLASLGDERTVRAFLQNFRC